MPTAQRLLRNLYRDSITLMQFSKGLSELPGVRQASAVMATPGNLSLLVEAGLLAESTASSPCHLETTRTAPCALNDSAFLYARRLLQPHSLLGWLSS